MRVCDESSSKIKQRAYIDYIWNWYILETYVHIQHTYRECYLHWRGPFSFLCSPFWWHHNCLSFFFFFFIVQSIPNNHILDINGYKVWQLFNQFRQIKTQYNGIQRVLNLHRQLQKHNNTGKPFKNLKKKCVFKYLPRYHSPWTCRVVQEL